MIQFLHKSIISGSFPFIKNFSFILMIVGISSASTACCLNHRASLRKNNVVRYKVNIFFSLTWFKKFAKMNIFLFQMADKILKTDNKVSHWHFICKCKIFICYWYIIKLYWNVMFHSNRETLLNARILLKPKNKADLHRQKKVVPLRGNSNLRFCKSTWKLVTRSKVLFFQEEFYGCDKPIGNTKWNRWAQTCADSIAAGPEDLWGQAGLGREATTQKAFC